MSRVPFGLFVAEAEGLVVQPRMGFSDPVAMRAGLLATKAVAAGSGRATTVGTITLDSYTRVGDHDGARQALAQGIPLNGFPMVAHGSATTRAVLDGVVDAGFPVQVRHGSADPRAVVDTLLAANLDATEGGPVSYCLPYSRMPLRESTRHWKQSVRRLGELRADGHRPHLETFGGCVMGQMCPPALLVAISVLEAVFFRQNGVRCVSMSYAQQTSRQQDEEAIRALRVLAAELLGEDDWHVVVYAYMGVYPRSALGGELLLADAARLAVRTGARRLIVKTVAEAHRIPEVAENVSALKLAAATASRVHVDTTAPADTGVLAQARALVECVLNLHEDVGEALVVAFARGYLDVPFCLHPDNANRARSRLGRDGALRWAHVGAMPIEPDTATGPEVRLTAPGLLSALSFVRDGYDRRAQEITDQRPGGRP